ncbi:hypothetical protein CBOM_03223 [Ceraceosorus bombacis]|uniref:BTB domain-containing protein n=1 Tax=Ceraceosorus bombacis TaxID=401625 RepID=A0A0P1BLJ3_9BASI|nr:hypothetical protein CBOM_03223 [Ceraceosorus bombacis]
MEEVVHRLHSLGSYFWTRPETVNLVVIVTPAAQPHAAATSPRGLQGPSQSSRRDSHPAAVPSQQHASRPSSPLRRIEAPGRQSGLYERRAATKMAAGEITPMGPEASCLESSRRDSEASTSTCAGSSLMGSSRMAEQSYTPATSVAFTPMSSNAPSLACHPAAPTKEVARISQLRNEQRRASAPSPSRQEGAGLAPVARTPAHRRLTYRVHSDYLTTQSTLFRDVLAELKQSPADADGRPTIDSTSPLLGAPQARLIRPAAPNLLPAVVLPLPDPSAFSAILHYLYFGDFTALASAMDSRLVKWEGIVANAEALGCGASFKRHLGRYWRSKVASNEQAPSQPASPIPTHLRDGQGTSRGSVHAFSMAAMMARRTESSQGRSDSANDAKSRRPMSREKRPLSSEGASRDLEQSRASSRMGQLLVNNDGFAVPCAPSHAKHRRVSKELEPSGEGPNMLSAMSKVRIAENALKAQHFVSNSPHAAEASHAASPLLRHKDQPRLGSVLGRDRAYTWTSGRVVSQPSSLVGPTE